MPKPLGITDLRKAMEVMNNWKLSASRILMNKKEYEDLLAFDTFECPECGATCGRITGHPDNGCGLGDIYNIMEL